jgi:hypothetical protein
MFLTTFKNNFRKLYNYDSEKVESVKRLFEIFEATKKPKVKLDALLREFHTILLQHPDLLTQHEANLAGLIIDSRIVGVNIHNCLECTRPENALPSIELMLEVVRTKFSLIQSELLNSSSQI